MENMEDYNELLEGKERPADKVWPLWMSIGLPVLSVCVFIVTLVLLYLLPHRNLNQKPQARVDCLRVLCILDDYVIKEPDDLDDEVEEGTPI